MQKVSIYNTISFKGKIIFVKSREKRPELSLLKVTILSTIINSWTNKAEHIKPKEPLEPKVAIEYNLFHKIQTIKVTKERQISFSIAFKWVDTDIGIPFGYYLRPNRVYGHIIPYIVTKTNQTPTVNNAKK